MPCKRGRKTIDWCMAWSAQATKRRKRSVDPPLRRRRSPDPLEKARADAFKTKVEVTAYYLKAIKN